MEASPVLHRHHQSPCSLFNYYCPSPTPSSSSSHFLIPSSSFLPSSSIRASSSPSLPSSDPPMQNHQNPEAKSPQNFIPLPKVSSFDAPLQNLQHPEAKFPQNFNPLPKVLSFATITAASVFVFLGYCQNGFINKQVNTLPLIVSIQSLNDESNLEEFLVSKSDNLQTILRLKLKEKVPIVHSFNKTKTVDDEAWQVLKDQVSRCSVALELVKVGFEEILEKDLGCKEAYHERVLEYLELIDECKCLLKGIKVAMDICGRENRDIKYHLRCLNEVVARIRVLEGDMVGALKHFQELVQE